MVEYIEKGALLQVLGKMAREPRYQHEGEDYYVGIADACGAVTEMPAAEVVLKPNYRVAPEVEWIRQFGTNKQIAGYEKRNGNDDSRASER